MDQQNPWLTLAEAIFYLVWRELPARDARKELKDRLARSKGRFTEGDEHKLEEAGQRIIQSIAAGRVQFRGEPFEYNGDRKVTSQSVPEMSVLDKKGAFADPFTDTIQSEWSRGDKFVDPVFGYQEVLVDREQLLQMVNQGDERLGGSFDRAITKQKPVSRADLKEWFENRLANWPRRRRHPTREQDIEDAQAHFNGRPINREYLRSLRPPEWRKAGPPRRKPQSGGK